MEGGGVGLSSLGPRYHALVFTVDVSQWLGFIISSEALCASLLIVLRVMRHNTNSRTIIQITKECTKLMLQCVDSLKKHTHVALAWS